MYRPTTNALLGILPFQYVTCKRLIEYAVVILTITSIHCSRNEART